MLQSIKKQTVFILFIVLYMSNFGQTLPQTVNKKVVYTTTDVPLKGTTVTVLNSESIKGTITGVEGYFKMKNVSIGRQFLAYNSKKLSRLHKKIPH